MLELSRAKDMNITDGFKIIEGVKELSGKRISLISDTVTTTLYTCQPAHNCVWKKKRISWTIAQSFFLPKKNWCVAELRVFVEFEYNGCDINIARLTLAPESFVSWYNDRSTYALTAKGHSSKITGKSGCPGCCRQSACVIFDVEVEATFDFVRIGVDSWEVSIFGDGDFRPEQKLS